MVFVQPPKLGLRIRDTSFDCLSSGMNEENIEQLLILISQEKTVYTCRDYLARRRSRRERENASMHDECDEGVVDTICRETMCEWSYRVCDHFHINREIVAISMSMLDRFVDNCSCDRTSFKLAAMTTLYIAIKTIDSRQISMRSLTELSRGEFAVEHMAEMETIILKTLGWRVNPPTAQAFIRFLLGCLPHRNSNTFHSIYKRAKFFSELCLYDYTFTTQDRSMIAVAALLNALEGVDGVCQSQEMNFLRIVHEHFGLEIPADELEAVRNRLWHVYSMSAQCEDDNHTAMYVTKEPCIVSGKGIAGVPLSPVSVVIS